MERLQTVIKWISLVPVNILAFLSKNFNRLPSELRFTYYMGSSMILSLVRADVTQIAAESNNAYIEAVLTFFVVNTLQYLVIKLGEYANALRDQ